MELPSQLIFISFMVTLGVLVTFVIHIFSKLYNTDFPLEVYPIVIGIMLAAALLSAYVIFPIIDKLYLLN